MKKKQKEKRKHELSIGAINNVSYVFFFIFSWLLLRLDAAFYAKVDDLSLFLFNGHFLIDHLKTPGGFLVYLGTFFTQFFYQPIVGCTLLALFLTGLSFLVKRCYNIPVALHPLTFLPASLLIISYSQMDYVLLTFKTDGFFYSTIIGFACVAGIHYLYRRYQNSNKRLIIALLSILSYSLIGAYSLLAIIGCLLLEITSSQKYKYFWASVFIVLAWALVSAMAYFIYYQIPFNDRFFSGLPAFAYTKSERTLWLPLAISACLLLAYSLLAQRSVSKTVRKEKPHYYISSLVVLLLLSSPLYLFKSDPNLTAVLNALMAVEQNDWEKVVTYTAAEKHTPNRSMVMLRNLALYKTGKAGDAIFQYPDGDAPYPTSRNHQVLRHLIGKPLYYHYGKINYCYRWCMEDHVEYGLKAEHLKYMTKCALINQEFELAKKYIQTLKKTLFFRKWAIQYEKLAQTPALINQNTEIQLILPLMAYNDQLDGDGGMIEPYLLNNFTHMSGGPPALVELSMQSALIQKNLEAFWPKFMLFARHSKRIPLHYQEAALLFAQIHQFEILTVPIDDDVKLRFKELIHFSEILPSDLAAENNPQILKRFGKTYWYYYFFVKNLQTN